MSNSTAVPSQAYLNEYNGGPPGAFASAFIAIEFFVVALRFVAVYLSRKPLGLEDWFTIPALLTNIALCAIVISFFKHGGAGHHLIYVVMNEPQKLPIFAKLELGSTTMYFLSITFAKLSMLCLFLRIFVRKWERIAYYTLMAVVISTAVAGIMANFLQCIPLHYVWDGPQNGEHCFNQNVYWRWSPFPNILTDAAMIVLPIPSLYKLHLSWRNKAGILFTFLLGGVGLITSILRFAAFLRFQGIGPASDGTWANSPLAIYSIAEAGVYLMAACIPSYRSLYLITRRTPQRTSAETGLDSNYAWKKSSYAGIEDSHIPLSKYYEPITVERQVVITSSPGSQPLPMDRGRFDAK